MLLIKISRRNMISELTDLNIPFIESRFAIWSVVV